MPELTAPAIPSVALILDLLLIIAVAGLWIAWWRNLNRLRKTEHLLADSIRQLVLASSQLKQATDHIHAFEKGKGAGAERRTRKMPGKRPAADAAANSILADTLRLQGEGRSDEEIARSLDIPVSQVRLMLKMHAGGMRKETG